MNNEATSLIERLEALEAPCRECDEAICDLLFTERQRTCIKGLSDEEGGMNMWRYPNGHIANALRFTTSLDAAMTLVPEGHSWSVNYPANDDGSKSVFGHKSRSHAIVQGTSELRYYGPTPAIALCIASLKAQEASNGR